MYRGFYMAASGMLTNQTTLNTISNNIANATTAGYKKDTQITPTFGETLLERIENDNNAVGIGLWVPIRYPDSIYTDYTMGPIEVTNLGSDFVIQGEGFFTVQAPENDDGTGGETFLTRSGQMTIDTEGYLVVNGNYRVLSSGGGALQPINDDLAYLNGMLYAGGEEVGEFLITYPTDTSALEKDEGNTMFTYNGDGTTDRPDGVSSKIVQGAYEASNVNAGEEMLMAMEAQRAFTACSQVIKMIDALNERSISEIGKV